MNYEKSYWQNLVGIRFAGEFAGRIQKANYGIELREWRIKIVSPYAVPCTFCLLLTASCQLVLRSFAKMTVRVGTLSTVFAESTVTEKSQLCLTDLLPCKNPRQNQIQNRDLVIKTAGGHS